jgi:ubiquitin-protein ligase
MDGHSQLRKILLNQLKRFRETPPYPNLFVAPDERDFRTWYFLIEGLEPPTAGEYIFKLTAPDSFPHKPPRFEFLTPNGTYEPGGPVCISIGEFHAGDKPGKAGSYGWRPALGMGGFALQVVNGLICHEMLDPASVRIIQTSAEEKNTLALESREYNRRVLSAVRAAFDGARAPLGGAACPGGDPEMSAYIDELLK